MRKMYLLTGFICLFLMNSVFGGDVPQQKARQVAINAFVCDEYQANDEFHFNWGWNGYYNSYNVIDDLVPGGTGTGGGAGNFSYNQQAAFNVPPSNGLTSVFSGVKNPLKSRGIPASPYSYTRILPDGSEITLMMRGDAVVNWEETEDGYTVLNRHDGFYVYAASDKYGNLMPTNILANGVQNRSIVEQAFLSGISKHLTFSTQQIEEKFNSYYAEERDVKSADKSFLTTGNRKLIAILVEFSDETFTRSQSEFNDLFNSSNYSLEGATGSVKQYFSDNSFEQLDLTTDVVGPYTLPNNMAYYGGNDGSDNDLRPQEMISDAIALANPDVDFSEYDSDNDGYVDGVYVVYAGYSEASGASEDAIWPHRWALPYPGETYDGVTVYDYSCSNELYGNSGTYITGIGSICHEFGHNCGLPDYYDTDYAGSGGEAFTLGAWEVMDGGSYNNYGCTPPFFNSFSRYIVGWQTPTLLQSPESVTLPNIAENNISYYYTTQTSNEYFLLENRQKISWDAYIPHHGLIIYHVDEDYIYSHGNSFNTDPNFQGFDLVEADNTQTEGSRTGDPFPGVSNNTSFTDATTPSAQSYDSQNTNKPVTDIQEISQVIYFDFMGGTSEGDPVADFAADPTTVIVGQTVNFTDLSTGVPDAYSWTFEGGTPGTSTNANPSIVYNTTGTYNVTLYVSNTYGNDIETKTDYITVTDEPLGGWIEQASGFTTASRGITHISIVDANTAWAIGYDGTGGGENVQEFTKTSNGGDTWTPGNIDLGDTGLGIAMITAISESTAWIVAYPTGAGQTGGIWKTTDGGANWTRQNSALYSNPNSFSNVVYFWDANDGFCQGDPIDGEFELYTTTDGGSNWNSVSGANIPNPLSGEYGYTSQIEVVGNDVWFTTNKGRIYHSSDKGYNWEVFDSPISDFGGQTASGNISFKNSSTGILVDNNANVYKTTNSGANWTPLTPTGTVFPLGLAWVEGTDIVFTTGAAQDNSGSSYSDDGGETWTTIDSEQHLYVDFIDENTGYSGWFNTDATTGGMWKWEPTITSVPQSEDKENTFTVYPNPTEGTVRLTGIKEKTSVKLYNITGSLLTEKEVYNDCTLDLSNFSTGIYLVELKNQSHREVIKVEKLKY